MTAGFARVSSGEAMTPEHYLECASLSKTVGTAFAIEYFTNRGVSLEERSFRGRLYSVLLVSYLM